MTCKFGRLIPIRGTATAAAAMLLCGALAGCSVVSPVLEAVGVSAPTAQMVQVAATEAGTLFCQNRDTVFAITRVKVTGATAAAVQAACSLAEVNGAATPDAVPVPPPAASSVPVGTVDRKSTRLNSSHT